MTLFQFREKKKKKNLFQSKNSRSNNHIIII